MEQDLKTKIDNLNLLFIDLKDKEGKTFEAKLNIDKALKSGKEHIIEATFLLIEMYREEFLEAEKIFINSVYEFFENYNFKKILKKPLD